MKEETIILTGLKMLGVLTLVLMNGLFVAAELAMIRIRDSQLEALAARGNRRAGPARHILQHIDAYIGATQFGITLASLGLGMAVEPVFNSLLEPVFNLAGVAASLRHHIALGVGFFTNCYLLIVAGELVPKAVAIRRTLKVALLTASPLVLPGVVSVHLAVEPLLANDLEVAGDRGGRITRQPVRRGAARRAGGGAGLGRPAESHSQRAGSAAAHGAGGDASAQ